MILEGINLKESLSSCQFSEIFRIKEQGTNAWNNPPEISVVVIYKWKTKWLTMVSSYLPSQLRLHLWFAPSFHPSPCSSQPPLSPSPSKVKRGSTLSNKSFFKSLSLTRDENVHASLFILIVVILTSKAHLPKIHNLIWYWLYIAKENWWTFKVH